jgi:endonuclease/exonuclease/phosphatase family metal-dependent hydrolase
MLQNLYPHLLAFHGLFRWVVLAAALAAIFVALSGWSGSKPASTNLQRLSVIFVIAMDIEFLTGLVLYFVSPITRAALANIGEAMKAYEPRFFTLEHTALMFLAVVCAHLGGALSRKGRTDLMKYRGAAIAYTISLLLMLSGIPWWRPLLKLGS